MLQWIFAIYLSRPTCKWLHISSHFLDWKLSPPSLYVSLPHVLANIVVVSSVLVVPVHLIVVVVVVVVVVGADFVVVAFSITVS